MCIKGPSGSQHKSRKLLRRWCHETGALQLKVHDCTCPKCGNEGIPFIGSHKCSIDDIAVMGRGGDGYKTGDKVQLKRYLGIPPSWEALHESGHTVHIFHEHIEKISNSKDHIAHFLGSVLSTQTVHKQIASKIEEQLRNIAFSEQNALATFLLSKFSCIASASEKRELNAKAAELGFERAMLEAADRAGISRRLFIRNKDFAGAASAADEEIHWLQKFLNSTKGSQKERRYPASQIFSMKHCADLIGGESTKEINMRKRMVPEIQNRLRCITQMRLQLGCLSH